MHEAHLMHLLHLSSSLTRKTFKRMWGNG